MEKEREPFYDQLPAIYRPKDPRVEIAIGTIITVVTGEHGLAACSMVGIFHMISNARRLARERSRQRFG